MSDTTVHTPKTFSLEIEKIAFQKRVTHLEAISIYCEQMGIEPVTTAKLLTKSLKENECIDPLIYAFPTTGFPEDFIFPPVTVTEGVSS